MENKKFYMTTAIAYTSGKPHIGNTYEFDPTDADALVDFISTVIAGNKTGFLGKLFGN